jgi:3-oxoacyl-[acyl-carrier protein] reductase
MCARTRPILETSAAEIQSLTGSETLPIAADVTVETDLVRIIEAVRERWGRIDILVTNAGGPPGGPFEAHSMDAWRKSIDLNFLSAVQLCRLVVPFMKQQRWGRIIHIASVTVKQPVDGLILSNAVRSSVAGFSKSLANELGPYGVLVNTVCPGYTRTARLVELARSQAARLGKTESQIREEWERLIPLGRLAEPEEFAAAVVFLASERASYITGVTVQVDGGFVRGLL